MNDEYFLPYSLESIKRFFNRFVIYSVGSTDGTENIIDWFIETNKKRATFHVRILPYVEPIVQGSFRNSMIAEAGTDFYMIVDGDEVYNSDTMLKIDKHMREVQAWTRDNPKPYHVIRRVEIDGTLRQRYDRLRSHHRVYHRSAIWKGTHPGEEAIIPQIPENEAWIDYCFCYHFHGALRTSVPESTVPKRIDRKNKQTYTPGNLVSFDLLDEVPILRKPIENFPVNPELEKLQKEWNNGSR